MQMSNRFEIAVSKLYNAFHDGSLHPECAQNCAVGNICDNKDSWKHFSDVHGSTQLNYVGLVNQNFGKRFNGYTPIELLKIEAAFLKGCGYSLPYRHNGERPQNPKDPNIQFKGLCEAITQMCKLDGMADIMNIAELLDYEISLNSPQLVQTS